MISFCKQALKGRDETLKMIKYQARPQKKAALLTFLYQIRFALKLIKNNKLILLFSLGNWVVIAVTYFVFIQIFKFVPDQVWESAAKAKDSSTTPSDLILFLWSIICILFA
jgi:hypothetical protein